MRILRYLLSATIGVVIIGVVALLIAREVFAYWGVSTVRTSVLELARARDQGSYQQECHQRGKSVGPGGVIMQLRFLSSTEYVLEALCNATSNQPIPIGRESLPPFVEKVKGSSGFASSSAPSGIQLAVFWQLGQEVERLLKLNSSWITKTKVLIYQDEVLIEGGDATLVGNGPITSCTGYGYTCCREESEMGIGDRIVGLTDCQNSCFSQCVNRPLVLSFTSNPFFDLQNRTVTVPSGTQVEFIYVADSGDSESVTGSLDFGDGKSETLIEENGQASHTYVCNSAECRYETSITLQDKWGVESAALPVSKITIIVQGRTN